MKFKKFIMAAAIVLVLGAAFSIPSVQSAAADLLQSFRMEKVNAVTINPAGYGADPSGDHAGRRQF